jgi:hypothetical protein
MTISFFSVASDSRKVFSTLEVCTASSLVGEIISAVGDPKLNFFDVILVSGLISLFSSGRPNISVLPEPVALEAITS